MHPAEAQPNLLRIWGERTADLCHGVRGRRLQWAAFAYGIGIGIYFGLPREPHLTDVVLLSGLGLVLLWLAWKWREGAGLIPLLLAVIVAGVLNGVIRTHIVAGPVLEFRYYGAVEGRVVHIDRSASGATRLTLDHVRLDGVPPAETPRRVRLSLHGDDRQEFAPGWRVMTTGHLAAPNGPVEPGGFDFQRHAWFLKLGAVGYARVPVLHTGPADVGIGLSLARLRALISDGLQDKLPGARGAVAAAITTGDRSALPEDVIEALRASNLAHLLAISGLHMGLLVGFVFWATRGGLALIPAVALRYPTRSWAALVALPFAVFYLFLSGGSIATQRAFVMAAVMLVAILVGRRALSLRSVAIAALIVLTWRPESLTGPGFQMSFAATSALVIAFRALSQLRYRDDWSGWFGGWRGALLGLLVSSLVAGAATAPFAALHFNRIGQFGVLANLLAVPVMGLVVMPLLLVALLLWPLGLGWEAVPLWLAGQGILWIIHVAEWVAGLPGALTHVPAPAGSVLPLIGLGMAIIGVSAGRGRGLGVAVLFLALALWGRSPRPDILIASDGRLVGILTEDGRWLSRPSGAGFAAENWLENDGDPMPQAVAAGRVAAQPRLPEIVALRGKTGLDAALARCASEPLWIVTPITVDPALFGKCLVFDETSLRQSGSVLGVITTSDVPHPAKITLVTAAERQGLRPWTHAWQTAHR